MMIKLKQIAAAIIRRIENLMPDFMDVNLINFCGCMLDKDNLSSFTMLMI